MREYNVFISEPAEQDLFDIFFHISTQFHAPETAEDMIDAIHHAMLSLNHMPKRNPLVNDTFLANLGYRIQPIKNYLIFYSVTELPLPEVNIERVSYNRRNWQYLLNR